MDHKIYQAKLDYIKNNKVRSIITYYQYVSMTKTWKETGKRCNICYSKFGKNKIEKFNTHVCTKRKETYWDTFK